MVRPAITFLYFLIQIFLISFESQADQLRESTIYISVNLKAKTNAMQEYAILAAHCQVPSLSKPDRTPADDCRDTNNIYEWTEASSKRVLRIKPI